MSSWRTYSCELKNVNKDYMKKAFDHMGFILDNTVTHLSNSRHYNNNVDAVLRDKKSGNVYDLGLVWEYKDTHQPTVVGDFYNTGFNSLTFMDELTMEYNLQLQMAAAEAAGYTIDETTMCVNADGELEVEAYLYA